MWKQIKMEKKIFIELFYKCRNHALLSGVNAATKRIVSLYVSSINKIRTYEKRI